MNPTPAPASVRGAESCVAPLTTTYRRLGALSPNLNLGIAPEDGPTGAAGSAGSTGSAGNSRDAAPAGDDRTGPADAWTDLGELAREPRVLDALLEAEGARCAGNSATGIRPDVVASRMLHRILWATCLLLSGPWYLERRVPRLGPSDVRIGRRDEALQIVVPGGFACLPDDPAASLTGAHVLPDEEALRQELRTAAADQARPLIAALAQRARRGPRALWGMVEDDLVSGIWHLGRATGEEDKAVAAAGELLPKPMAPFPAGAGFRRLHGGDGTAYATRTRAGCCLFYAVSPGEACGTCPRVGDADRLARIEAG